MKRAGIEFEEQYPAIPQRKFRYDFFVPPDLLIEVQGGVWQYKPSHTSAKGIIRDCEKVNLATLHGYRLLQFTGDMIASGEALEILQRVVYREQNDKQTEYDRSVAAHYLSNE